MAITSLFAANSNYPPKTSLLKIFIRLRCLTLYSRVKTFPGPKDRRPAFETDKNESVTLTGFARFVKENVEFTAKNKKIQLI